MDSIIDGVSHFRSVVFPKHRSLYQSLVHNGQKPKALLISCADSRVVPEFITQSEPGEMFVCRNVGNIVPPFSEHTGGVSSAVEYAVVALGVKDIVICGHSDCGAMKALLHPELLTDMPSVSTWLSHGACAHSVFNKAYGAGLSDKDAVRVLAMENVVAQINHLRGHPAVAARVASGHLNLHGWFFDLDDGSVLALDGNTFVAIEDGEPMPVALPGRRRVAIQESFGVAAE
jgi:carbonic anhydrase